VTLVKQINEVLLLMEPPGEFDALFCGVDAFRALTRELGHVPGGRYAYFGRPVLRSDHLPANEVRITKVVGAVIGEL
jgi:hypothetical protein